MAKKIKLETELKFNSHEGPKARKKENFFSVLVAKKIKLAIEVKISSHESTKAQKKKNPFSVLVF